MFGRQCADIALQDESLRIALMIPLCNVLQGCAERCSVDHEFGRLQAIGAVTVSRGARTRRVSGLRVRVLRTFDHEVVVDISRGLNKRASSEVRETPHALSIVSFAFARRLRRRAKANDTGKRSDFRGQTSGSLEAHQLTSG